MVFYIGLAYTPLKRKAFQDIKVKNAWYRECVECHHNLWLIKGRGASLVAQSVKNLPAMQETRVRSLGGEDPLEEEMATHPSILAWRIPIDRGAWWAMVHGVAKSWTRLSN